MNNFKEHQLRVYIRDLGTILLLSMLLYSTHYSMAKNKPLKHLLKSCLLNRWSSSHHLKPRAALANVYFRWIWRVSRIMKVHWLSVNLFLRFLRCITYIYRVHGRKRRYHSQTAKLPSVFSMQMTNIKRNKVLPGLYSNSVINFHPSFI